MFFRFVQDKITLASDEWYLTLGSKVEHNDYTGFEVSPTRAEWLAPIKPPGGRLSAPAPHTQLEQRVSNVLTGVITTGIFPVPISVDSGPTRVKNYGISQ